MSRVEKELVVGGVNPFESVGIGSDAFRRLFNCTKGGKEHGG